MGGAAVVAVARAGDVMRRAALCELFGIDAPILQAAIWPGTSAELVATVCGAGAPGTVAGVFTPAGRLLARFSPRARAGLPQS